MLIKNDCFVELAEDDAQFSFKIEFHGQNNRSYVLGAESQESMEQWMKALACAGYDYMKLMVAELQRQLDDIEGMLAFSDIFLSIFGLTCFIKFLFKVIIIN